MPLRLHPLGKKLFLEHMLLNKRNSEDKKRFLKALLLNKHFLSSATSRLTYKICISPNYENRIHLRFESYRHSSCYCGPVTFEFLCCLLKLLKPSFTEFDYCLASNGNVSDESLLTLMKLAGANGKVSLCINELKEKDDYSGALKHVYECVDELTCFNKLLVRADKVQFKLLDKLKVCRIRDYEQLNAVLKHPAKQLDLSFFLFHDESVQLHKNDTKQCRLKFAFVEDVDQPYLTIQNVLNACKKLETLEVEYDYAFKQVNPTFTMLLNGISQLYQLFKTLIESIRQFYPMLKITFKCYQNWKNLKIELPEDWQEKIKQIDGFGNVTFEEEEYEDIWGAKKISLHLKTDLTNATFCFDVWNESDSGEETDSSEETED